mgnify:CR=1 FL=1
MNTPTYGIVFCGYNPAEYIRDSLAPFLGRDNFIISAVSVPFSEYRHQDDYNDGTTEILQGYKKEGLIDNLVTFPKYLKEHDARNLALNYLKDQNVDFVWIVDSDEDYDSKQVTAICNYVESSQNTWFKICLKNFVFDKKHYLEEPFCPPRIFRTKTDKLSLPYFFWDNDIAWTSFTGQQVSYKDVAENETIPQDLVWVDHYTWLSDEIGKRKVKYQEKRGWECSYKWNEEKGVLEFNEEFHKKIGEDLPVVIKKT